MVQILTPRNHQKPSFAQSIVGGLAEGTADELKHYAENKGVERQLGINLSGIKDPNTRAQIIGDQLKRSRGLANAKSASEIDYSSNGANESTSNPSNSTNTNEKITTSSNTKNNQPKRNPRVTQPVKSQDEVIRKSQQNVKSKLERNLPADFNDEFNIENTINENQKKENAEIKKTQQEYGQVYLDKLENVWGKSPPNDEIKALFKRKGENGFAEGKTEGEIDADAAVQARKFKNDIANATAKVEKYIAKGSFDKNIDSLKIDLKPMLDDGLYDTVRGILDKAGGYPEQIEKVISNLSEVTKKNLSSFEKLDRPDESWWDRVSSGKTTKPQEGYDAYKVPYSPEQTEVIRNNIKDVLTQDPAANLVLLREAYLDKDIEWDEFKNIVDELFIKGEIKLSDDQQNQLSSTLDNPPLQGLGKILKNLRIF
jgi:flagellar biosynthesis/type III secretory pathway protein FliH